jgi:predicted enzyme related to lactoylglutathione lyase
MNGPSYFEIQADDVNRAVHFYKEIFGWKFSKVDGLPVEYWRIETDGPQGGLLPRPAKIPATAGASAFVCSMEVNDFDSVAQAILDKISPLLVCGIM